MSVLLCLWRLQWCYKGGRGSCLRLPCACRSELVVMAIPCYGGGEPPYIGVAGVQEGRPSPPQPRRSWTRSMIVEPTVGAGKPPTARTVSLPAQEIVEGPTVDVSSARSASFASCAKEASLVVRRAGTTTLSPPLIIQRVSAARASSRLTRRITLCPLLWPCALCGPCFVLKQPSRGREGLVRNWG